MSFISGCATLPSSGPTGFEIRKAVVTPADNRLGIRIEEVEDAASLPAPPARVIAALPQLSPPPTDMVGPGDVLAISIYEAGVTLFSGATSAEAAGFDPGVKVQTLPQTRVDDNGDIVIPYAGQLHVLGRTIAEVQSQIRAALRGFSQNPQVLVTMREVITNSIIVSGEVAKPGRLILQTNHETLSDSIALAGGYRGNAKDLTLRLVRNNSVVDMRLSDLIESPAADIRAYPGDRLAVILDPRSFSVLGASGRIDQVPFSRPTMSLAEAISVAGGPNPNLGDPAAIFLFRYVPNPKGTMEPVVYHINMMKTGAYFLIQNFRMHDKDVLYFGNARANQPAKVIQLVSQLFSPIATVTSAVQIIHDN